MNAAIASLFIELLTNAGWVDDADELIGDMLDHNVPEDEVRAKCRLIDDVIRQANELLTDEPPTATNIESTLDRLL
jgi:hypothetical protein